MSQLTKISSPWNINIIIEVDDWICLEVFGWGQIKFIVSGSLPKYNKFGLRLDSGRKGTGPDDTFTTLISDISIERWRKDAPEPEVGSEVLVVADRPDDMYNFINDYDYDNIAGKKAEVLEVDKDDRACCVERRPYRPYWISWYAASGGIKEEINIQINNEEYCSCSNPNLVDSWVNNERFDYCRGCGKERK